MEIQQLNNISNHIRHSYIWIVFALGFPGNIFCIVTVLTMQTVTPATFFISFLAFCDACALTVKLVAHQLYAHNVAFSDVGCRLHFVPVFLGMLTNWVLVMICAERFVSVCFPLKKALIFTKKRSYLCTAGITAMLLALTASLFGVMRASDGKDCGVYTKYELFWVKGWFWINAMLNFIIPFICVTVLTGLIIHGLSHSRRKRRSVLLNGRNKSDSSMRPLVITERLERTITVMLVFAAVVFLILSLPSCVFNLTRPTFMDHLTKARWEIFNQIQFVLLDSSHAVNFYLYFFSAKRFRCQFFKFFPCKKWVRRGCSARSNETNSSICNTKYTLTKSDEYVSQV